MAGTRVYLGGLPMGCKERDLEDFVNAYGRTRDILLKEGFAFIEFEDYRDADDAVYELNGRDLLGERVTVEHARPSRGGGGGGRGSSRGGGGGRGFSRGGGRGFFRGGGRDQVRQSSNRLIVENLSSQVNWQDLKDYMRQAGDVAFADAHKLRKNEGVVEFTSYSGLKIALDTLDGTELEGRRIRLREERKRNRGSRSSSIN